MANSTGVLPLMVTCVFLTVAALRINWAGVICAGSCHTGGPFSFPLVAVFEEPKVKYLRHQYLGHAFL